MVEHNGWSAFLIDVMRRPPPAQVSVGSRSSAKAAAATLLRPPPPPPISDAEFAQQVSEIVAKIKSFAECSAEVQP
jgi:hypothetical protein